VSPDAVAATTVTRLLLLHVKHGDVWNDCGGSSGLMIRSPSLADDQ
jgi:hypothetical protein